MSQSSLPPKPPPTAPPTSSTHSIPSRPPTPQISQGQAPIHPIIPPTDLIRFPPPTSSSPLNQPWIPPTPPSTSPHPAMAVSYSSIPASSSTSWKPESLPVRPTSPLPKRPASTPSLAVNQPFVPPGLPTKPKAKEENKAPKLELPNMTQEGEFMRYNPGTSLSSAIVIDSEDSDDSEDDFEDILEVEQNVENDDEIQLTSMKVLGKRKASMSASSQTQQGKRRHRARQGGRAEFDKRLRVEFGKMPQDADPDVAKRQRTEIKKKLRADMRAKQKANKAARILPIPLPSKRFNKDGHRRATLFPVEQLPVFALPPLPVIEDDATLKQVFTHQSLFKKEKLKFEDPEDDLAKHYEKIEHVGDSILGMIVTTWLHEIKPGLTPGSATRLKSHLVSNATLSHLSGLYNLPNRLIADPNLIHVLRASTDVRAALMEAYIAGFYFSHKIEERVSIALPILDTWLREMYEPLVDFFYTYMKSEHTQHLLAVGADAEGHIIVAPMEEWERVNELATGMTQLVKAYAESYDRELKWEEEKYETSIGPLFKMKCVIDGMELGEGTRSEKRDAKNVAAWEAAKKIGLTTEYRY